MTTHPLDLSRLQRWVQAVITHPEGIESGMQSDTARSIWRIAPGAVESLITPSRSLSSIDRLHIYGNAYFARLLECLRTEFPALVHLLGQEVFDGFAFGFLNAYPSRSYTLADLAALFPQYLEESRPAGADEVRPDFADFIVDLARLERAYSEVFDDVGPEREPGLRPDVLQSIPADAWEHVRLTFFPCVRLMSFRFPVHAYALSVRRSEQDPTPPDASTTFLALTRRKFVVHHLSLTHAEFVLLQRLRQGLSVGDAIDAGGMADAQLDDAQLSAAFESWTAAPLFQSVLPTLRPWRH